MKVIDVSSRNTVMCAQGCGTAYFSGQIFHLFCWCHSHISSSNLKDYLVQERQAFDFCSLS